MVILFLFILLLILFLILIFILLLLSGLARRLLPWFSLLGSCSSKGVTPVASAATVQAARPIRPACRYKSDRRRRSSPPAGSAAGQPGPRAPRAAREQQCCSGLPCC